MINLRWLTCSHLVCPYTWRLIVDQRSPEHYVAENMDAYNKNDDCCRQSWWKILCPKHLFSDTWNRMSWYSFDVSCINDFSYYFVCNQYTASKPGGPGLGKIRPGLPVSISPGLASQPRKGNKIKGSLKEVFEVASQQWFSSIPALTTLIQLMSLSDLWSDRLWRQAYTSRLHLQQCLFVYSHSIDQNLANPT